MKSHPVKIIAEAGVNHNGSKTLALELIAAAAEAGADVVKFQTFDAKSLATSDTPKAEYQKNTSGAAETQQDMLARLQLQLDVYFELFDACASHGVEFLSTPFDLKSLAFLVNDLRLPTIKLGSGELTNAPLLHMAARSGRNIILSTGMANIGEVEQALGVLAHGFSSENTSQLSLKNFREALTFSSNWDSLRKKVTLLHCTSAYPADSSSINLNAMCTLEKTFRLKVGYSDHSVGNAVPIAAVAKGACVIEKHFTLDKNLPGPDHSASIEPDELQQLVSNIRTVEAALGNTLKQPSFIESQNKHVIRKTLVASKPLLQGDIFSEDCITTKRAGGGISAMYFWDLVGRKIDRDYKADEPIQMGIPDGL